MSRTDLAVASGVRKSAIIGFERGTHVLSATSVAAVHAALTAAGAALAEKTGEARTREAGVLEER